MSSSVMPSSARPCSSRKWSTTPGSAAIVLPGEVVDRRDRGVADDGVVAGRVVVDDDDPLLAAGGDAEDRVVERLGVDVDAAGDERVERGDVVGEERQLDVEAGLLEDALLLGDGEREPARPGAVADLQRGAVAASPPPRRRTPGVVADAASGRRRRRRRRARIVVVVAAAGSDDRARPAGSLRVRHRPACMRVLPTRAVRRGRPTASTVGTVRYGFVSWPRTARVSFEAASKDRDQTLTSAPVRRDRGRARPGRASRPPTARSAIAAPIAVGSRSGRVSWRNQFCTASSLDMIVSAVEPGVDVAQRRRRRCPRGRSAPACAAACAAPSSRRRSARRSRAAIAVHLVDVERQRAQRGDVAARRSGRAARPAAPPSCRDPARRARAARRWPRRRSPARISSLLRK